MVPTTANWRCLKKVVEMDFVPISTALGLHLRSSLGGLRLLVASVTSVTAT
jgi:hypothetical protein